MRRAWTVLAAVALVAGSATLVLAQGGTRTPAYQDFTDSALQSPDVTSFETLTLGLDLRVPTAQLQDVLDAAAGPGAFTALQVPGAPGESEVLLRLAYKALPEGLAGPPTADDSFGHGLRLTTVAFNTDTSGPELVQFANYRTDPNSLDSALGFPVASDAGITVKIKEGNGAIESLSFSVSGADGLSVSAKTKAIPGEVGGLVVDDPLGLPLRILGAEEDRAYTLGRQFSQLPLDPAAVTLSGARLALPDGDLDILGVDAAELDTWSHLALSEQP